MEMGEVIVPETRGRKPKYDFSIPLGGIVGYPGSTTGSLLVCAKNYCRVRNLDWEFRCYTMDGVAHIVRIK